MNSPIFTYPLLIKESHLDTFGHVNNAVYLTLYEEARWDIVTKNGYGLKKIMATGLGPTILEIELRFLKEIKLREEIIIETQFLSYDKKIGIAVQRMLRDGVECSTAKITFGLFDTKERKIVSPTPEWLKAIGATSETT